ncbi:MAG: MBL fold metallo-hydrolase [Bdellovibrionaceae bacterium]|nr:MBL fold metallo-hydrolase [Pseudobdellovibrionaceae bacterium]
MTFLGGAGTVTGSKFLFHHEGTRVLVDCGSFMGLKRLRLLNWEPFPFDPAALDAVVLTHAHLDHSGHLPVLVSRGFRGPIYCTKPTAELVRILLFDAARLQEEDADYANKKGFSKHKPALPLFTVREVEDLLQQLHPIDFCENFTVGSFNIELRFAGHILGAASVSIKTPNRSVLVSGDVGRPNDPLIPPPEPPLPHDILLLESTYGGRNHSQESFKDVLIQLLQKTFERKSVLMIPSFAVGRAQNILFELDQIYRDGLAPQIPVYMNSPMAIEVTRVYDGHCKYHRLTPEECQRIFTLPTMTQSADQSKALNQKSGPMVIIAGSGMLTGGRILHHIKAFAHDPDNTILLAGFQAEGTRGASLLKGKRELKFHGQIWPIRCQVVHVESISAHADQNELTSWVKSGVKPFERIFLVHGEESSLLAFQQHLKTQLPSEVVIAAMNTMVSL